MRGLGRQREAMVSCGRALFSWLRHRIYLLICAVLVIGSVLLADGYLTQSSTPPAPSRTLGAIPAPTARPLDDATAAPATALPPAALRDPEGAADLTQALAPAVPPPFTMAASPPVSVRASAVGIDSPLLQVGLNKDGTVEVPTTYTEAAWYRLGPAPGARGPAVLVGHVDSYKGPGIFFKLGALRPGQIIDVARADNSIAHFRVDAVSTYGKGQFPTAAVYGPIDYAGLRVITCGGTFDEKRRSYESNVVVFASLIQP